jgi:hypothetical protein
MGYDLLLDFWDSFSNLEITGAQPAKIDPRAIEAHVREPMFEALRAAAGPLAQYDLGRLREQASGLGAHGEFWVTLDHKVYFRSADYELDQTRTADDYTRLGTRSLRRRPRADTDDLQTQVARLAVAFRESGATMVVVADDGICSGHTMSRVVEACAARELPLTRVVVCCNNTDHRDFHGVPVESIVKHTPNRAWLNERDLYWGLPRSGIPLATMPGSGIPFSIDPLRVTQRIEVEDQVEAFRSSCLRANAELWRQLEHTAGRVLTCEDSPLLRFVPDVLGLRKESVVALLERLANTDYKLRVPATV